MDFLRELIVFLKYSSGLYDHRHAGKVVCPLDGNHDQSARNGCRRSWTHRTWAHRNSHDHCDQRYCLAPGKSVFMVESTQDICDECRVRTDDTPVNVTTEHILQPDFFHLIPLEANRPGAASRSIRHWREGNRCGQKICPHIDIHMIYNEYHMDINMIASLIVGAPPRHLCHATSR